MFEIFNGSSRNLTPSHTTRDAFMNSSLAFSRRELGPPVVTRELKISGDERDGMGWDDLPKLWQNGRVQELVVTSSDEQYLTPNNVSAAADTLTSELLS